METLGMIAGNRKFPLIFAQAARKRGIRKIVAVAFEGETEPELSRFVDAVEWVKLGQLNDLIGRFKKHGVEQIVMVGQIAPKNLFNRISLDLRMTMLLAKLRTRNAETIFGAIGDELAKDGLKLIPHAPYLDEFIPKAGPLTKLKPTSSQQQDIEFARKTAKAIAALDIGQTVVVKEGTVLAVEAFEGTDACLLRGGQLGQGGSVAVKVTKPGQDMRFDIPVVGMTTIETTGKAGIAVLALEAGRTLLLERDDMVAAADKLGVCLVAIKGES
jgi:UDP-2,3-diacylglucosamine hydrolase